MSGFEEYKKISKNEPIIVNNNNAQKQINDMNGLLDQERDKGVEIKKSPYDYDPDQLLEHFRQRTADDTDEAFNLRTKYYFQDEDYMTAKARRYQKINQRGEYRGKLDEYSQRYSYHKAKNRQYAAETASIKFADARDKQQRYKNDGAEDSLTQYKHRKEIMKDRMAALESVAYVKAQNKKHEKYLIGRSRLSGNLILKDQLDHFIAKETHDPQNVNHQMVRDLNRELAKVESEIKKATKIVVDNVPKAQDKWREANRLNNAQYTRSMNAYREELNPGCEKNSAILMTEFTLLETQVRSLDWPKKSVLTLGEGNDAVPISKAEMENREWNNKYDGANDDEKLQMQREALERFKEMPLPSASAIKNSGARKYITTNLRNYYDLTKRALPYYKRLLANPGNDPISQEIQNDAVLRARITYLDAIDRYIDYRLRRDHQIVYGQNGFEFETDPQYRYNRDPRGRVRRQRKYGTGADGRSQSNAEFTLLSNAFTAFQTAMRGEGAAQNNPPQQHVQVQGGVIQNQEIHNVEEINANNPVNIIINDEQFDQPGPEDIIVAKNTVKNMINLFENKGKNNINTINENNNNIINVEEDVKENLNKINVIKEDAKENLNKINVIIEDKKNTEAKKEKNKNVINENVINENVINENVIIEKKKEKKVDPIKEFKIKIIKTYSAAMSVHKSVRLNKAIKQAFKLNILDTNELDSQNALAPLLDSLNYEVTDKINLKEKGDTDQDEKIRLSNEAWAKLWTSNTPEKVKAREAMIAEKLPKIFDGVSLPTVEELKSGAVFDQKDGSKKLFDLYNIIRKVRGLQVLANVSKTAANICNNEVFKNKTKVITNLDLYLSQYLRDNYNMKETDEGLVAYKSLSYTDDDVDSDVVLKEYEKLLKSDWDKKIVITEMKEKPENEINENKINENVINENVINENKIIVTGANKFYISDDKIASFKKVNPNLSDNAIKILKAQSSVFAMKSCPEYLEALKKAEEKFKGGQASDSIDRVASYVMRPVMFDENYKPLKNKENLANHEWNLKWINAWEEIKDYTEEEHKSKIAKKTGQKLSKIVLTEKDLDEIEAENEKRRLRREENKKIRKEMIEEEAVEMWKGFNIPPMLEKPLPQGKSDEQKKAKKEALAAYQKELNKWIDEQFEKDPVRFYALQMKFPAFDTLYKNSLDLRKLFMKDPTKKALEDFATTVNYYLVFYLIKKYHIQMDKPGDDKIIKPDVIGQTVEKTAPILESFVESVAMAGDNYKKIQTEGAKFVSVKTTALKKLHDGNIIVNEASKNAELELKKNIAEELKRQIDAANNEKVALRRKVDIKDKKKLDFKSFEKLSAFGTLFDKKEDLAKYCDLYGNGLKKQKADKNAAINKDISDTMDKLTDIVLKMNLKNIDVSSDEHLMASAFELEKISGAVEAYNYLLSQNPAYLDLLKNTKTDDKAFPNKAEEIMDKVIKLSAVSDYYRTRKLVITDENYTDKINGQISYQSSEEDGTQMRRLKKLMRASYVAAVNLGRVFGEKIPKQLDVHPESEDEKAIFDNLYRDAERVETEKKERIEKERLEKERLEKEKKQKNRKNKNKIIEEDKKLQNKLDINMNIKDSMLAKLDALIVRDKQVKRLENERLFQAPIWMHKALTLDPNKIPTQLKAKGVKNPFFSIDNEKYSRLRQHLYLQEPAIKSLDEKRRAVMKEMTGDESFGGSPKFVNDDVKYLGTIDVSDSWSRLQTQFATDYMYGSCEEEMIEMTELMKIQDSKEWKDEKGNTHSKNWSEIAEDKEAVEFYKSAFIELSKKLFYSVYASARRAAETFGLKALILHPTDLTTQMTYELRQKITSTSVFSNIVDNRSTKGETKQDVVKKLFDDYDDGTYNLDIEDYMNISGIIISIGFKINATTLGFTQIGMGDDPDMEDDAEGLSLAVFGNANFFDDVVLPEYEQYIKDHPLIDGKVDGIFLTKGSDQIIAWFLNHHPEYINRKALNAKYKEEGALEKVFVDAYNTPFSNNEYDIAQTMKKKSIDIPSQEELDKYEKHLAKEKYPKVRSKYYAYMKDVLEPNESFKVKDEKGNVIGTEKNKLKLDARKKDPYGVKLFKTGFSELNYVDKQGKKHFRVGV